MTMQPPTPFFRAQELRNMIQNVRGEPTREVPVRGLRARNICFFKKDLSYLSPEY